jgi:hypothetical protein
MKYRVFSALCILLCLVPLVGLLIFGPAQPAANETLAGPPSWTTADGAFNWDVLSDLSDYLGDRFALRQEMVTAWRTLLARTLGQSDEETVILGREGWLFYGETLDDYEGLDPMTDRQIFAAARCLSLMQEAAEGQGARFLFTVAPNKNTLYGSYMPTRYPAAQGDSDLRRLAAELARENVAYLDLEALLGDQNAVLYRRYDSHWTNAGAALAGDAILEALEVPFTPFYGTASTVVDGAPGDLYQMLYPTGTDLDEDVAYDRPFTFTYDSPIRSAEDNRIVTSSDTASGGRLVLFRDSFGNALYPFLAENFQSALFSRANPYDLTLAADADAVVIELVERNLDWLLTRPAILAAPIRTLDDPVAADPSRTATATVTDGDLDGYVRLSGCLDGPVDDDSPIYLHLGDTLYEASPAGDGELPFTAYVPADAAERPGSLLVRCDGQWVECSITLS